MLDFTIKLKSLEVSAFYTSWSAEEHGINTSLLFLFPSLLVLCFAMYGFLFIAHCVLFGKFFLFQIKLIFVPPEPHGNINALFFVSTAYMPPHATRDAHIRRLMQKVSSGRFLASTCLFTEKPHSTVAYPCDKRNTSLHDQPEMGIVFLASQQVMIQYKLSTPLLLSRKRDLYINRTLFRNFSYCDMTASASPSAM